MSHDMRKTVEVQSLNLAVYARDEVYPGVDQTVDLGHSLQAIYKAYVSALARLLCNNLFEFRRGIITAYFSAAVNLASATYPTAVHHVESKKFFKGDYRMITLDGGHQSS